MKFKVRISSPKPGLARLRKKAGYNACGGCPNHTGAVALTISGSQHTSNCDGLYVGTWKDNYWHFEVISSEGAFSDFCASCSVLTNIIWKVQIKESLIGSGYAASEDTSCTFGSIGTTSDCGCNFREGKTNFTIDWTCRSMKAVQS